MQRTIKPKPWPFIWRLFSNLTGIVMLIIGIGLSSKSCGKMTTYDRGYVNGWFACDGFYCEMVNWSLAHPGVCIDSTSRDSIMYEYFVEGHNP